MQQGDLRFLLQRTRRAAGPFCGGLSRVKTRVQPGRITGPGRSGAGGIGRDWIGWISGAKWWRALAGQIGMTARRTSPEIDPPTRRNRWTHYTCKINIRGAF